MSAPESDSDPVVTDSDDEPTYDVSAFEEEVEKVRLNGLRGMGRREFELAQAEADGSLARAKDMHVDDLSSDDEEAINTIGNVPLKWYEEEDHIGYTLDGEKLVKASRGDGLDRYLASQDDPNYRKTVYDAYNDREVVLSDRQLTLIRNVMKGNFAHPEFNDTPDYVPLHSNNVQIHAMGSENEPKRRFIPSKWERKRVMKIVQGIKEGRIKINEEKKPKPEAYLLWGDDNTTGDGAGRGNKAPPRLPPPKPELPGHNASYNPPKEYLPSEEERKEWLEMDPEDRPQNFIPRGFDSMRLIPRYDALCKERFDRCLDLHMAPRAKLNKLNINPDSLLPRLPSVNELKPFPNAPAVEFEGVHAGRVRCLSVSPTGQWLATGGEDGKLVLWEVQTGRCMSQLTFDDPVGALEWNPVAERAVLAVGTGKKVLLLNAGVGTEEAITTTNAWLQITEEELAENEEQEEEEDEDGEESLEEDDATKSKMEKDREKKQLVFWKNWKIKRSDVVRQFFPAGRLLSLKNGSDSVMKVTWHRKGDYLATLTHGGAKKKAVIIHQVSTQSSRAPFSKDVSIQAIRFHPSKPFFFVASQTNIRVYNLQRQTLVKKLLSGAKWISSMSIHPKGDHVIVGTYDRRLVWFDLDLSDRPYKTLKYHDRGLRAVHYHATYPLMASASDDGTVHVFHARVYDDLIQNPLIVPVKILKGHKIAERLGVMDMMFHPTLPWLFSCGSDGKIILWQNL